jgi:spore coat protein YutH
MKETINYYYNLNPYKINKIFNYYYFYLNNELYYFIIYDRKLEDAKSIYNFNKRMLDKNILVNEIISNKSNSIITYLNDVPYILMKIFVNINKTIKLPELSYISNVIIPYDNNLMRSNWADLWIKKIDYLEYHHEQNYQKYPLLAASFDYFIGLSENAIAYLNNTIEKMTPDNSDIGVISHETLTEDDTIYSLYNPLNIIIDHKARDLAEYIKLSFFNDNFNIFEELDEYFKYNYFSFYGINLLIARILYPSFYFDKYDEIVSKKVNESSILKITSRTDEYEKYLQDIFSYFHKYYNIKDINWLKKRG